MAKTENVGPSKSLLTQQEIFDIFISTKLKIRSPEQHVGNDVRLRTSMRTQRAVVARFRRVRTKNGFSPWFLNARGRRVGDTSGTTRGDAETRRGGPRGRGSAQGRRLRRRRSSPWTSPASGGAQRRWHDGSSPCSHGTFI